LDSSVGDTGYINWRRSPFDEGGQRLNSVYGQVWKIIDMHMPFAGDTMLNCS